MFTDTTAVQPWKYQMCFNFELTILYSQQQSQQSNSYLRTKKQFPFRSRRIHNNSRNNNQTDVPAHNLMPKTHQPIASISLSRSNKHCQIKRPRPRTNLFAAPFNIQSSPQCSTCGCLRDAYHSRSE
jgi:hypothetical protein